MLQTVHILRRQCTAAAWCTAAAAWCQELEANALQQRPLTLCKLGFTSKDKKFLHIQGSIFKLSTIRRTKVSSHPMETFLTGFHLQWTKNISALKGTFVNGLSSDGKTPEHPGRGVGAWISTDDLFGNLGHFCFNIPFLTGSYPPMHW